MVAGSSPARVTNKNILLFGGYFYYVTPETELEGYFKKANSFAFLETPALKEERACRGIEAMRTTGEEEPARVTHMNFQHPVGTKNKKSPEVW